MKNDPETLTIRPPEADDGSAIAHLFSQLGYPAEGADVTARLLAPDPDSVVLLASQGDKVVGVLVWHKLAPLHVAPAWGL
ncbi:MAG: GNAT family N-acetyltransferase, partial [Aeromonas veronii]